MCTCGCARATGCRTAAARSPRLTTRWASGRTAGTAAGVLRITTRCGSGRLHSGRSATRPRTTRSSTARPGPRSTLPQTSRRTPSLSSGPMPPSSRRSCL
eukprot:Amastigsp_a680924_12.p3 type:complete len:100 gc:universal Amastigsp_a680924_12:282-581(+)